MQLQVETQIYKKDAIKDDVDDARTKATSFITTITEESGIRVHDKSHLTDYVQVNSNDISMWIDSKERMALDEDSLTFYGYSEDINDNEIQHTNATYGNNGIVLYKPGTTTDGNGNTIAHDTPVVTINSRGANIAGTVTIGDKYQSEYLNENVQVGGRNLICETGTARTFITRANQSWFVSGPNEPVNSYMFSTYSNKVIADTSNLQYTLSFNYAITQVDTAFNLTYALRFTNLTSTPGITYSDSKVVKNIPIGQSGSFVKETFDINSDIRSFVHPDTEIEIVFGGTDYVDNENITLTISNLKFEIGNKATDWSVAPEDVQAEIDTKKSTHTIDSTYSISYTNALAWANASHSYTGHDIDLTNVKIEDTVRLGVFISDMGDPNDPPKAYIVGTVTEVNASSFTMDGKWLDTTVIDGGHILTGTIDAQRVNISNLTVGGGWENLLNSNLKIGGRNYAITNWTVTSPYTNSQTNITSTLVGPSNFTLNGTASTTNWAFNKADTFGGQVLTTGTYLIWFDQPNIGIDISYGNSSVRINSCTKNNPHKLIVKTEQAYSFVPIVIKGVTYSNLDVHLMIEKSDNVTDWSPAPEDVRSEINAKTSTWTLKSGISTGAAYSTILGYAAEGVQTTFTIDSSTPTTGIKKGDNVRLAYLANNMGQNGTVVYIMGTVAETPTSTTSIKLIGHGLDTTVIDGGHILTGTIDANKVNINHLTVGSAQNGWNDVLNSEIEIGGRNLVLGTGTAISKATTATSSYVTQVLYDTPNLITLASMGFVANDEMTLSFDWKITSASTYGNARIEWYGYKDASNTNSYLAPLINPFTTFSSSNTSGHISTTVKLTSTTINSKRLVLRIDNSNLTLTISNLKLEKGNKATDWTPAPEDIDVHRYVTQINSDGIWVTPFGKKPTNTSTGAGATGTKIDKDGVGIYVGGTQLAQYGTTTYFYEPDGITVAATLNGDGLNIKTGTIELGTYFKVSSTGALTAKSGTIGGWNISTTGLCSATTYAPASGRILLAPAGVSSATSVGGSTGTQTWGITVGTGFGVTTGGKLYATDAVISGTMAIGSGSTIDTNATVGGTSMSTIKSNASNGASAYSNSIKSTVSCYYRKENTAPTQPTADTSIGTSATTSDAWEYVMPQPKRNCTFYTCEEYTPVTGNKTYSTMRELSSETYASKWVSSSDNTYIDGGRLYANSVTADQISVNNLSALNANMGTLTSGTIKYGTVGSNDSFYLSNTDTSAKIGGQTSAVSGLRLTVGSGFGVTKNGTLYATGATISGKITISDTTSNVYTKTAADSAFDAKGSAADAATKATNYITVSGDGILVRRSTSDNTNGVKINSDGVRIYRNANNYAYISTDGLNIYQGGNSVALFGATARIGKQSGSHVLTTPSQFGMFSSTDEPYFSVTNTGSTRNNQEHWQGTVIAPRATATLGRFPLKNTSATVEIWAEDDDRSEDLIKLGTLTNANVRTNNYSVNLSVDTDFAENISGYVSVTCTNSASSSDVTITCKSNLNISTRVLMVYKRSIDIPMINFTGDNKLLWSGMREMSDIDYVRLNESVSQQLTGIALVWAKSDYSAPNVQFVPKDLVRLNPSGNADGVCVNTFVTQAGFANVGTKTVYITDYEIIGHSENVVNQSSGTASSIGPRKPAIWYLVYVFGV